MTKTGKVKMGRASGRHLHYKSGELQRSYRDANYASKCDLKRIRDMLHARVTRSEHRLEDGIVQRLTTSEDVCGRAQVFGCPEARPEHDERSGFMPRVREAQPHQGTPPYSPSRTRLLGNQKVDTSSKPRSLFFEPASSPIATVVLDVVISVGCGSFGSPRRAGCEGLDTAGS